MAELIVVCTRGNGLNIEDECFVQASENKGKVRSSHKVSSLYSINYIYRVASLTHKGIAKA